MMGSSILIFFGPLAETLALLNVIIDEVYR